MDMTHENSHDNDGQSERAHHADKHSPARSHAAIGAVRAAHARDFRIIDILSTTSRRRQPSGCLLWRGPAAPPGVGWRAFLAARIGSRSMLLTPRNEAPRRQT